MLATAELARQNRNRGDPGSWQLSCRRVSLGLAPLQPMLGKAA